MDVVIIFQTNKKPY